MFFGNELISKKEPIRVLWLAATLGRSKKLSKKKILEANIPVLTSEIIEKGGKLIISSSTDGQSSHNLEGFADYSSYSLRLSSTLLLGVVVIFNKKAQYLLSEGNLMVHKARQISVRLDQTTDSTLLEKKEARFEAITLKPFKDFELITDNLLLAFDDETLARWYKLVGANSNGECDNEELTNLESSSAIEAELNGSKLLENEQQGDISMIKPVRESDIFMAGLDIFEAGIVDPITEQQEEDVNNDCNHELGGLETSIIEQAPLMTMNDNELDTAFTNTKKRKRTSVGKLILDDQTQLSSENMRSMIQDYSSLVNNQRGVVRNNPFSSKSTDWFDSAIFSRDKLDKTTMDRLLYTIPCGYDSTNEQFNSDFDEILSKSLKKQKSEKESPVNDKAVADGSQPQQQLAEEDVQHLNNFLDGELGGLDGDIEQPREEHYDNPERMDDELTSILLNPGDISVLLSPTGPTFQRQTSPQKRPSLIAEETDELLKVFEDKTAVPICNNGSTMVPKSWGMLEHMKKKVEEESLTLNNGEKVYLSFDKLIREGNNTKRLREKASQGFYQLLVLASNNHIDIKSLDKIYVKQ